MPIFAYTARETASGREIRNTVEALSEQAAIAALPVQKTNIAAWKRLEPALTAAGGARLSRVRVYETPEIFAEYEGGL